jgi:hypothetical protein
LKSDVNVASKSIKQKTLEKNLFLVAILKVTDESSSIQYPDQLEVRIRIRTKMSRIRNEVTVAHSTVPVPEKNIELQSLHWAQGSPAKGASATTHSCRSISCQL